MIIIVNKPLKQRQKPLQKLLKHNYQKNYLNK
nr:MAG TPA: hypothetical protein [Crassvirales sp.]